jgi:hypothetical protein
VELSAGGTRNYLIELRPTSAGIGAFRDQVGEKALILGTARLFLAYNDAGGHTATDASLYNHGSSGALAYHVRDTLLLD